MTIIYKGRLITVTMEVPDRSKHLSCGIIMPSYHYATFDYTAHLESLWQSSAIHASKELMERFKDGETVVEGKDYEKRYEIKYETVGHGNYVWLAVLEEVFENAKDIKRITAVPLPAVEEGSQDETRDKLRRDLKEKFGFETGTVRRITAYLFNNYKLTKI